jgi:hypothetical protein
MQVGLGQPVIRTGELETGGLPITKAVEKLDNEIKKMIVEQLKIGGIPDLPYVNKNMPKEVEKLVFGKLNYIQTLMGFSETMMAKKGVVSKTVDYIISESGGERFVDFGKGGGAGIVGTFVQDISIFGGAVKAGANISDISSGTTSPRPDIKQIETELKAYRSLDIGSGTIAAGVMQTDTIQETEALNMLRDSVYQINVAVWELANKMKNLLLIKIGSRDSPTAHMRITFEAIILFVQIIISRIYEWINAGLGTSAGGYTRSKSKAGEMGDANISIILGTDDMNKKAGTTTSPNWKTTYHWKPQGLVIIEKDEGGGGKSVEYKQTYDIKINPLTSQEINQIKGAKGDWGQYWIKGIKRITDLYLARYDILDTISGTGQYNAAAQFFGAVKNKVMGMTRFPNIDI